MPSPHSVRCVWICCLLLTTESIEQVSYEEAQYSQQCHQNMDEFQVISIFLRNHTGFMLHDKSAIVEADDPPDDDFWNNWLINGSLVRPTLNVSCMVNMQYELNCSWNTSSWPSQVQYSTSAMLCNDVSQTELHCTQNSLSTASRCHGKTDANKTHNFVVLRVNVSHQDFWYIDTQIWETVTIEKLDPPQIIKSSIDSDNLVIEWKLPESKGQTSNYKCFEYELWINDERRDITDKTLTYIEKGVDATRMYTIRMKVKTASRCKESMYWSDWTTVVVNTREKPPFEINLAVIITIALGLPMILLAFFLLCRLQRLFEKIFPPIPGPSRNIKRILEKHDEFQDFLLFIHLQVLKQNWNQMIHQGNLFILQILRPNWTGLINVTC
ncbi:interleukin-5 receptor subunit alpha-like isoform X2 [Denticeps clupeoides]|uniref:Uncharacterized protein n=2 Tax=Denticeps clupeoides TaxID=299321 RepID=A0AAY4AR75_9TELE|nr:interleukin-5 receptor subunit alpha-like isoform X2 [Denticeps clupeoides]